VMLATVGAAVAWIALRTPTYQASARMLIAPLPQDDTTFLGLQMLRDSGDPTRTAQTAATLAGSPAAAAITARKLGHGWDVNRVLHSVSVQPEGQSNILAVTGTADSPAVATRLANTFVSSVTTARNRALDAQVEQELANSRTRLSTVNLSSAEALAINARINRLNGLLATGDPTITPSLPATPPSSPNGAGALIVIPLALIAGLLLGAGTAASFDLASRRIRDEAELIELYPLPVLARVPLQKSRERRMNREQPLLLRPPEAMEAFRTITTQLEMSVNDHRSLMITSASTGDGKTTSSVNLALSLTSAGHSVVLLDLDLRKGDVAPRLNIPKATPTQELSERLNSDTDFEAIDDLLVEVPNLPQLRVLSISATPDDSTQVDTLNRQLPGLLKAACGKADYVVIDTPPLGEISDALRIAQVADAIILVARVGNTRRRNIEITRELLERTGASPTGYLLIGGKQGTTGAYYQSLGAMQSARSKLQ
jgi:capsular exopolysaccharide synthesis family protein